MAGDGVGDTGEREREPHPQKVSSQNVSGPGPNVVRRKPYRRTGPSTNTKVLAQNHGSPADSAVCPPSSSKQNLASTSARGTLNTGSKDRAREVDYTKPLHTTYFVRQSSFFHVGIVFMALWSETASPRPLHAELKPPYTQGVLCEHVFSKTRRFVVVRASTKYCIAVPISTYGNQGVCKKDVVRSEHAIIYTGDEPPEPIKGELNVGMGTQAIRVEENDPKDKLDERSRVNVGKLYTVEHNIKVAYVGVVKGESLTALQKQLNTVWEGQAAVKVAKEKLGEA